MDLKLKDKTVLVTGSAKGIGLAIVAGFAREGAKVFLNARSSGSVESALAELKKQGIEGVQGVVGDVGTQEGIQAIIKALPRVDVLINNAGIFRPEEFGKISRESWMEMFTVNVLSGAQLTQHYLPKMIEKNWGRVIFISSESAINIPAEMVHYGMSKTAQLSVARGAAETCKGTGVTVNSVLPGPTFTEGVGDFLKGMKMTESTFFKEARPSSINQRFAKPEEVANVVVFVSGEGAAMINGAALRVDGGVAKTVF